MNILCQQQIRGQTNRLFKISPDTLTIRNIDSEAGLRRHLIWS
jgi:hypothetical protein